MGVFATLYIECFIRLLGFWRHLYSVLLGYWDFRDALYSVLIGHGGFGDALYRVFSSVIGGFGDSLYRVFY